MTGTPYGARPCGRCTSAGGVADGPFFRSGQALFASTPAGTHTPPAAPLDAGLHAGSAFTAGAQAPSELRTTVDHQTVRILNSSPPAPDVIPDVRPDDGTLTPGQKVKILVDVVNRGNRVARHVTTCLRLSVKLHLTGRACRIIRTLPPGHTRVLVLAARARRDGCAGRLIYRLRVLLAGQSARVRRAVGRLLAGPCSTPPCPSVATARRAQDAAAGTSRTPADDPRPRARIAC